MSDRRCTSPLTHSPSATFSRSIPSQNHPSKLGLLSPAARVTPPPPSRASATPFDSRNHGASKCTSAAAATMYSTYDPPTSLSNFKAHVKAVEVWSDRLGPAGPATHPSQPRSRSWQAAVSGTRSSHQAVTKMWCITLYHGVETSYSDDPLTPTGGGAAETHSSPTLVLTICQVSEPRGACVPVNYNYQFE